MCLDRIYERRVEIAGVGYHVAQKIGSELYPSMMGTYSPPLEVGKWMHEGRFRLPEYKHKKLIQGVTKYGGVEIFAPVKYPFGWHIFESQEEAQWWRLDAINASWGEKKYILNQVRYRSAVAWGGQLVWIDQSDLARLAPIVVAKGMLILPG